MKVIVVILFVLLVLAIYTVLSSIFGDLVIQLEQGFSAIGSFVILGSIVLFIVFIAKTFRK